jgi:hypothetical protein
MVWLTAALSVWMSGDSPTTVTVSANARRRERNRRPRDLAIAHRERRQLGGLKSRDLDPNAIGRRREARHRESSFTSVVTTRWALVPLWTTVTVAPGMPALLESST